MSAQIIPIHVTRVAKERGVMALAGIRALAAGLSQFQTEALMRYARDRYRCGHVSAARAVADSCARVRELSQGGAA